ncbi:MAG TPA: alpha/beta fold hydrolase [Chitinophagaceae bacterium]|nr:alpha/beta fold hydrolase [Chitinophagaceae bacterium]
MKKSTLAALVALAAVAVSCRKDHLEKQAGNPLTDAAVSAAAQDNLPETSPAVMKVVTNNVGNNVSGYVAGLPARYDSTSKNYPLLVFIHGMGQLSSGTAKLSSISETGVAKLLQQQQFPASFNVNGKAHSFIVAAPQFANWATAADVNSFIDYMVETYRVDAGRIYIAGFNMGGAVAWEFAGAHPDKVAAIIPIAGPSWADEKRSSTIASNGIGVWAFHNTEDKVVLADVSKKIIEKVNSFNPKSAAKLTLFNSGEHDAWTKATDPSYKENGLNIYEWMLQFSKSAK